MIIHQKQGIQRKLFNLRYDDGSSTEVITKLLSVCGNRGQVPGGCEAVFGGSPSS